MPLLWSATPGPVRLANDGLLLPVTVIGPSQRPVVTQAQVDTGSTITSVDQGLLQSIGAVQSGSVPVETVNPGITSIPLYAGVSISAQGGANLTLGIPGVLGDDLPAPVQVLLGRDVLAGMTLIVDGPDGYWEMDAASVPVTQRQTALHGWLIAASAVAVAGGLTVAIAGVIGHERRVGARQEARREAVLRQAGRRRAA